jgi:hypothetical protein
MGDCALYFFMLAERDLVCAWTLELRHCLEKIIILIRQWTGG